MTRAARATRRPHQEDLLPGCGWQRRVAPRIRSRFGCGVSANHWRFDLRRSD